MLEKTWSIVDENNIIYKKNNIFAIFNDEKNALSMHEFFTNGKPFKIIPTLDAVDYSRIKEEI